ncbi:small conductance mechanosensitive channel [Arcticibacter tournemirensis]|uniref:Mechanosensitive ion channel family protein n=1 Tax=Arcticibacter tournemirensis TaxID=699437 RepID=A0A5M9H3R6_9SPHI|nr:mechanosensitive ion channel family protein [Arcticibacter tournemirensis]KAA8481552.1 mechanosensitive ion channel family protein [Arcticibacter tournemirensis]TQM49062.1 small conductance mechanosensitive channel [Arcticibacter tournemirensis]
MELEKFYDKAYDWILRNGPGLILAIIILLVGLWVIRLVKKGLARSMEKRKFDTSLQPFIQSLIIISLQVMLLLIVMQTLGIQLTILTTVIGAFSVAAGLALSGTLQNFASGVLILVLKPFKAGDNIIAQGQEGIVSSIQIFYTVVTTFENKTVIIPNSKLSNEIIINVSRQGNRRMDIELKFNYGFDMQAVKAILEESAKSSENILKIPEPRIGVSALEPDGYKMMVNVWVNAHGFIDAKLNFQEKLISDLKNAGIKLPGM